MTLRDDGVPWAPPTQPVPTARKSDRLAAAGAATLGWTSGVELRRGEVAQGGSPWRVTLLPPSVRSFARKLHASGRAGLSASASERAAALYLLDRGLADPLPPSAMLAVAPEDVEVVIPVYGNPAPLARCLAALSRDHTPVPITVVDDGSPQADGERIRELACAHGARLVVRPSNGGPGDARNTGFSKTSAAFIAFLDADMIPSPGWLARLRPILDDPVIGAVGPRILPDIRGGGVIERYEAVRSELDMGPHASRVVADVPVGWLPGAAMLVRRSAVTDPPFEPGLRVGEDVDFLWRMREAGWTVRYVPDVETQHEVRTTLAEFCDRRRFYGTSAAELERRHPGRMIPARPWLSGVAILAALASRRPALRWIAAPIACYEFLRTRRALGREIPWSVALRLTGRSLSSDVFWVGHVLRRELWPIGLLILLLAPRSRAALVLAAVTLWPSLRDHLITPGRNRQPTDFVLRLLDDASYGTGVIQGAITRGVLTVLVPKLRFPGWPDRGSRRG